MTTSAAATSTALDGLLVVDLSRVLTGPYASMTLADLGARVIKVEPPEGDETRNWGPPFLTDPDGSRDSTYFLSVNRNKESLALNLKDPSDHRLLLDIVSQADVLIENYRPGVAAKLGLSPAALWEVNPRLVILSITGFGHDGPDNQRGGYDQIAQAESGIMSLTGPDARTPTKVGVPIGDLSAGMFGLIGVFAALRQRDRTGRGEVVRTSLLSSLVALHGFQGARYLMAGEVPVANGNHHPTVAPYGGYACADGDVQIAVGNQRIWRTFAPLTGLDADDPRFATNELRVAHRAELDAHISAVFAARPAVEVSAQLSAAGVPVGVVRNLHDVYSSAQVASQGMVVDVDHHRLGPLRLTGSPIRMDSHEPAEHRPPPDLDQHGPALRAEFGGRQVPTSTHEPISEKKASGDTP